jgi:acyl-CoA-dependent ceramide synthase
MREMGFGLKVYYLLQASYWVQQFILLVARVEKPRKDFKELVAHVSWCIMFGV